MIGFDVPVMEAASVAVIVCVPGVIKVTEKDPLPAVSVEAAGSTAWGSLLEKCTVPEYVVTVLFEASSAVTVILNATPATALPCAVIEKWVAVD